MAKWHWIEEGHGDGETLVFKGETPSTAVDWFMTNSVEAGSHAAEILNTLEEVKDWAAKRAVKERTRRFEVQARFVHMKALIKGLSDKRDHLRYELGRAEERITALRDEMNEAEAPQ